MTNGHGAAIPNLSRFFPSAAIDHASIMNTASKPQSRASETASAPRAWRVLWSSTFAFAIWMIFAIRGVPLKTQPVSWV
jgi:hypothetical protein